MSVQLQGDPAVAVAEIAGRYREWLRARGALIVGTGRLRAGTTTLALHTDFGPVGQDKEINQDYALGWSSNSVEGMQEPFLAVALADGVTSSFRAEWGAELACAASLRALVESLLMATPPHAQQLPAEEHARQAVAAAERALNEVGSILARDPEKSCPPGQYISTWNYILRKGKFLQTTLILAWVQSEILYLAMIGDGGLSLRRYETIPGAMPNDEVLTEPDLGIDEVHALGPQAPELEGLDFWAMRPWGDASLCALYTDGVGRGMQRGGLSVLSRIEEFRGLRSGNVAVDLIAEVVQSGRSGFDDNLTLAVLTSD